MQLSVELSAICTRSRYTTEPAAVVDELLEHARGRDDILFPTVGSFVGYYEDEYTRPLCAALRAAFPACEPWVLEGRERRGRRWHSNP